MATKKAASAKKSKPTEAKKQTTTKVTTVKAVAADTPKVTRAARKSSPGLFEGRSPLLGACIAEFIGTFVLASVAILSQGQPLYVGFSLVAIVLMIGALSGSHVNPLLTVGAWATRKISNKRAVGYLVAQVLAAMLALVVMTMFIDGAPKPSGGQEAAMTQTAQLFKAAEIQPGKEWYVFAGELLGALVFGFAVSSALRQRADRAAQAFTVGFGLFTALIIAGVVESYVSANAVINPAIAITVSAVAWPLNNFWAIFAYVIAPILGGVLGFFLYDVLRGESDGGDDHLLNDEL